MCLYYEFEFESPISKVMIIDVFKDDLFYTLHCHHEEDKVCKFIFGYHKNFEILAIPDRTASIKRPMKILEGETKQIFTGNDSEDYVFIKSIGVVSTILLGNEFEILIYYVWRICNQLNLNVYGIDIDGSKKLLTAKDLKKHFEDTMDVPIEHYFE